MATTLRFLLAEDHTGIREILREMLTRAGVDVVACRNRAELDLAVEQGPYHAVISDLNLGDGQADTTLFQLRRRYPALPILILTGQDRVDPLLAMVAQGIFFKPLIDIVEVARYAIQYARRAPGVALVAVAPPPSDLGGEAS